jgi:hypothetical protein
MGHPRIDFKSVRGFFFNTPEEAVFPVFGWYPVGKSRPYFKNFLRRFNPFLKWP